MTEPAPAHRWHQTLPAWLGVVITVVIQTIAVAVWLSSVRNDLDVAMGDNKRQDAEIATVQRETQQIQITGGRVDATLQAFRESLAEVKAAQIETNTLLREIIQNGAAKK